MDSGIPYFNGTTHRLVEDALATLNSAENDILVTSAEDVEFIESALRQIDAWLQISTSKTLVIKTETSYRRRLIYQTLRQQGDKYLQLGCLCCNVGLMMDGQPDSMASLLARSTESMC